MRQLILRTEQPVGVGFAFQQPLAVVATAAVSVLGHKLDMVKAIEG